VAVPFCIAPIFGALPLKYPGENPGRGGYVTPPTVKVFETSIPALLALEPEGRLQFDGRAAVLYMPDVAFMLWVSDQAQFGADPKVQL
jgi:hypothetical protein